MYDDDMQLDDPEISMRDEEEEFGPDGIPIKPIPVSDDDEEEEEEPAADNEVM